MGYKIVYHDNALRIRLTIDRVQRYLTIPVVVKESDWSQEFLMVRKSHPYHKQINEYLTILIDKVEKSMFTVYKDNMDATTAKQFIASRIFAKDSKTTLANHCKSMQETFLKRKQPKSAQWLNTAVKKYLDWLNEDDIHFKSLTYVSLLKFKESLIEDCSQNTISNYLRAIRCVYNSAVDLELYEPSSNPFKKGLIPSVTKSPTRNISQSDIAKLQTFSATHVDTRYNGERREAVDFWLLGFYLQGADFIDIANLTFNNISAGYISFNRAKTGQPVKVKINPLIQSIIDKYSKTSLSYLLPIIPGPIKTAEDLRLYELYRRKQNDRLNTVCKEIKINASLTTKWLRHSWITIAKSLYIDESIRKQAVGHSDSLGAHGHYAGKYDQFIIDAANSYVLGLINSDEYHRIINRLPLSNVVNN